MKTIRIVVIISHVALCNSLFSQTFWKVIDGYVTEVAPANVGSRHEVVHWESATSVTFYVHEDGAGDGLTWSETRTQIVHAMGRWNQSSTNHYVTLTAHTSSTDHTLDREDGKNVIFWEEDPYNSPYLGYGAAIAATVITVDDEENQELVDVDIICNTALVWVVDSEGGEVMGGGGIPVFRSTIPDPEHPYDEIVIDLVMTHELGHSLGVGHTTTYPAVMHIYYPHNNGTFLSEDLLVVGFLYRKNINVPSDYSTIHDATSDAVAWSGQTVSVDEDTYSESSIVLKTGNTLTIDPGTTISFSSGSSLQVSGQLNAIGTSGENITLTASSYWNGIVVNSSANANIKYCTISNASPGICLNSANATVDHNIISTTYGGTGIYSYGSGNGRIITYNVISAYTAINADYYSTMYLLNPSSATTGHNETSVGSVSLLAEYHSNIEAGGYSSIQGQNSLYGGGIDPQVVAYDYGTVVAKHNWWNYDPSYSSYNGGSVDMSNPLVSDPNGGFGARAVPGDGPSLAGSTDEDSPSSTPFLDAELNAARQKMAEGNYEEAIRLFAQKYSSDTSPNRQRYALARIAECYKMAEKSGFVDFLNSDVRPSLRKSDDLYLETLELEALSLLGDGVYLEAVSVFERIKEEYSDKTNAYKHALFNLVNLYCGQLNEKGKAKQYVEELKASFSGDQVTRLARVLFGETDIAMSEHVVAERESQGEPSLLTLDNYPNPSNPSTTIRFNLPNEGQVTLKVYDLLGRVVADLVSEAMRMGQHQVVFDGSNFPSGVYFYRLEFGGKSISKEFVLTK